MNKLRFTLKPLSPASNVVADEVTGTELLFSYGIPVAGFFRTHGYVKTTERHSATTSKHVNQYASGAKALSPDEFAALVASFGSEAK